MAFIIIIIIIIIIINIIIIIAKISAPNALAIGGQCNIQ